MAGKIHFFLGIAIIITFLLTGQYMHHNYNHLKDMELMNRALFRAGHLYILLFGLINVSVGAYFRSSDIPWQKMTQWIGSLIIYTASFLIVYSFFVELPTEQIERPLARNSLYLVFAGVVIHGLLSLMQRVRVN